MSTTGSGRRAIAIHAAPESFEARALVALQRLGYGIVPVGSAADSPIEADLRIVDEERLHEISEEEPIILLRADPPPEPSNRRVLDTVIRPATLLALYTALQAALETKPRLVPRIATKLPARCWQDRQFWTGRVVSLSENGCLFGTDREVQGPSEFALIFYLPSGEVISTPARTVHRSGLNIGLAFEPLLDQPGAAVRQYVIGRLTV